MKSESRLGNISCILSEVSTSVVCTSSPTQTPAPSKTTISSSSSRHHSALYLLDDEMELLDLPNELLQKVAGFIHPFDLIAFVTTCQLIHTNAEARLQQHRTLRDKYSKIRVVCDYGEGLYFKHPLDVIHEIRTNTWLELYITDVCFDRQDSEGPPDGETWVEGCYFNPETKVKIDQMDMKLVDRVSCFGLTAGQKDEWAGMIAKGWHNATFVVLLTLLPNLTQLRLGRRVFDGFCFLRLMLYYDIRHSPNAYCLPKLHTLELDNWDTYSRDPCVRLKMMTLIPSLRRLHIDSLVGRGGHDPVLDADRESWWMDSNVEDINLGNCGQRLTYVLQLINPMQNLKRLDFESYFRIDEDSDDQRETMARARARFGRDIVLIEDMKGMESKTTMEPEDSIGSVRYTVRMRVTELAHEL